jgi:hypothetical protein
LWASLRVFCIEVLYMLKVFVVISLFASQTSFAQENSPLEWCIGYCNNSGNDSGNSTGSGNGSNGGGNGTSTTPAPTPTSSPTPSPTPSGKMAMIMEFFRGFYE